MKNLFIIIGVAILFVIIRRRFGMISNESVKNITGSEAYNLTIENKELIILDVRTKGEYINGHLPNAKSFAVSDLAMRINEIQRYKNSPLLVYCASGARSSGAVKILLNNDFKNIYHLNMGIGSYGGTLVR